MAVIDAIDEISYRLTSGVAFVLTYQFSAGKALNFLESTYRLEGM